MSGGAAKVLQVILALVAATFPSLSRLGGQEFRHEHHLDGRVTKKITPEQTYFFHWSPGGRLETVGDDPCDPCDAYGSFQYDARGRLSLEQREDGDERTYCTTEEGT